MQLNMRAGQGEFLLYYKKVACYPYTQEAQDFT